MDPDWGQGAVNNDIDWGKAAMSNNIYWGYSHYLSNSGDTNITGEGSTPPPEFTRYIIEDCITGNTYNTAVYDWGAFEINDRVFYNIDNIGHLGRIIDYTTEVGDDIGATNLGVNSANCFDNILNFISGCYGDEKIKIGFSCNPLLGNFNNDAELDTFISYNYYFNVYYEATDNEGNDYDGMSEISGTYEIGEYNFIQNQNNFMFEVQQERDGIVTYATIDSGYEQPYFGSTISFSDNDGCSFNYFLISNGYSYVSNFRKDNC